MIRRCVLSEKYAFYYKLLCSILLVIGILQFLLYLFWIYHPQRQYEISDEFIYQLSFFSLFVLIGYISLRIHPNLISIALIFIVSSVRYLTAIVNSAQIIESSGGMFSTLGLFAGYTGLVFSLIVYIIIMYVTTATIYYDIKAHGIRLK